MKTARNGDRVVVFWQRAEGRIQGREHVSQLWVGSDVILANH